MNIRAVKTGKDVIYMGKALGNIVVPRLRIKGNPAEYVKTLIASRTPKDEIKARLELLAYNEGLKYPIEAGKKMLGNAFWRNALSYYNSLTRPKDATK